MREEGCMISLGDEIDPNSMYVASRETLRVLGVIIRSSSARTWHSQHINWLVVQKLSRHKI